MSTDSTELTFVRCPSCRSLVPAVSTRCRMCGATLDASQAKGDEGDKDAKRSSRVRQRTMSQPDAEFTAATEKVRDEMTDSGALLAPAEGVEPNVPASVSAPIESEIDNSADPLSDYIDEVEVGTGMVEAQPAVKPPLRPETTEVEARPAAPVSDANGAKPGALTAPRSNIASGEIPHTSDEGSERSRVIIESGARRGGKPSGLSFGGKPRDDQQPREQSFRGDSPPRGAGGDNRPLRAQGGDNREGRDVRPDRTVPPPQHQAPPSQPRPEQNRPDSQRARGQEQRHPDQRQHSTPPPPRHDARQEAPRRAEGGAARLFGWLVSYAKREGVAIELREGKFFVSSSRLKPNDLVLDEPSISTPHALVSVSLSDGMLIQDLMSDRGVFLRKRNSDPYQRLSETARLDHGDWVRFGDVEYLVCVVAHVGTRGRD